GHTDAGPLAEVFLRHAQPGAGKTKLADPAAYISDDTCLYHRRARKPPVYGFATLRNRTGWVCHAPRVKCARSEGRERTQRFQIEHEAEGGRAQDGAAVEWHRARQLQCSAAAGRFVGEDGPVRIVGDVVRKIAQVVSDVV